MIGFRARLHSVLAIGLLSIGFAGWNAAPAMARPLRDSDLPADLQAPLASDAWQEEGTASYYRASRRFFRTSTGERYNEHAMTAAHPTLPLGSTIRVTNANTGQSVVVRINDRQSAGNARIIDLSYAAARKVGIGGLGQVVLTQASASELNDQPQEVAEAPDSGSAAPVHGRHTSRRSVAGPYAAGRVHSASAHRRMAVASSPRRL